MTLQKIEVEVPDGFKAVGYRPLKEGEFYLASEGVHVAKDKTVAPWLVLEKEVAYRTPTAADVGRKDIEFSFDKDDWETLPLVGFYAGQFVARRPLRGDYIDFPHARILDDNPPKVPREWWIARKIPGEDDLYCAYTAIPRYRKDEDMVHVREVL